MAQTSASAQARPADEMEPLPTPKSSPFTTLPTEILQQIVQNVARPLLDQTPSPSSPSPTYPTPASAYTALQTLFNLSLTSRLFYDLTLPLLYHEFSLGYKDIPGSHLPPQAGQRLVAFARTLLFRRDLAALVKRAFLHPKLVEQMGAENRKMISTIAKKKLKDEVFEDQGIEVLVFALMPNLERLVFAAQGWAPVPLAVRVAWEGLKGPEVVGEYGWSFSEKESLGRYEEMIATGLPLPDEDDDL